MELKAQHVIDQLSESLGEFMSPSETVAPLPK